MALSQNDIINTNDFNELKQDIEIELKRRSYNKDGEKTKEISTNFPNFSTSLDAVKNGIIDTNTFNNLINALNDINDGEEWTNFDAVKLNELIKAIVKLSTVTTLFADCEEYNTSGTEGSGCSGGCMGLCHGCSGQCKGSAQGSGGGGGGCPGDCTGSGCQGSSWAACGCGYSCGYACSYGGYA